jgi:RNA polymerase sigma-70 factor (ECF subfamily)
VVLYEDGGNPAAQVDLTMPDHADSAGRAGSVAAALARLSPEHRGVLVECYYRGRTVGEAATTLGLSKGTVRVRIHDAVRALRLVLEEMGNTRER